MDGVGLGLGCAGSAREKKLVLKRGPLFTGLCVIPFCGVSFGMVSFELLVCLRGGSKLDLSLRANSAAIEIQTDDGRVESGPLMKCRTPDLVDSV